MKNIIYFSNLEVKTFLNMFENIKLKKVIGTLDLSKYRHVTQYDQFGKR